MNEAVMPWLGGWKYKLLPLVKGTPYDGSTIERITEYDRHDADTPYCYELSDKRLVWIPADQHELYRLRYWIARAVKYLPTQTECQCQGEHDCEPCRLRREVKVLQIALPTKDTVDGRYERVITSCFKHGGKNEM